MSPNIEWNDTIKKEARGSNDEDLGEVARGNKWLCSGSKRLNK